MSDTCTIIEALQERFSQLPSQCSPEQPMFDAQGREYLVVYRTLPTSLDGKEGAIASNLPNFQLNKDYLQDFQARDLSAIGESSKIRKIAQKLDPTRLLVASGDPTIGAPVVWTDTDGKSYVLGGNGRTIAFLLASDDRYKDYVNEASQRWFNVYDKTERKGYRNLLVRDVYKSDGSPLSIAEAVKLAGASQESTAGKETPLRQALSRARGMGITKDTDLGQIVAPMALSPYTIDKFTKSNFGFFRKVMELVPEYIRVQLTNVDDKTKPIAFDTISSVLVGRYLPVKFVQEGFGNDKEEEAIIGVLPSLVALQQAVDNGRIYPQYDLLDKLETARSFMKLYRWKSYGDALQDYKTQCDLQTSFLEPSPVCAMNKLGVAFGLYLKRMVQSSDPTKGVSDINKYIDKALEDDPNMVGMFGEPTPQEIEDKATKAFISLALPSKLGETLLQQNPSEGIMDTDRIIIEALPARFRSIEKDYGEITSQSIIKALREHVKGKEGIKAIGGGNEQPKYNREAHRALKGYGSEDYRLLSLKVYQAKKGDRKAFTFFIADDDPSKLMVADSSRNKFEKPREIELDQAKEIIDGMVLSSNIDPQFLEFIKSQDGAYYEVVGIDTVIVRPEEPEYVSEDWEYREEEGEEWYKAQMWKRTKALMNKIKEKFPSIKIASASERGLILEFSSSPFTIYQYSKAGDRTKLESHDDVLKALENLPQEIVFVYKSPIGFYVRIIEFVGWSSFTPTSKVISRLENTAYSLSEELSSKGEIVAISLSILSINKPKKLMKDMYNHNFMFSNTIDIKDIQKNAKPFSDFLSKYISTDIFLKIPQKAKPKPQKPKTKMDSVVGMFYFFDLFKKAYEAPDVEELWSVMNTLKNYEVDVQRSAMKKIAQYLNVDLKEYEGREEYGIEALRDKAIALIEEEPEIEEEAPSLKPYRAAPSVADILFIHDSDGTQIQLQTRQNKSRFKEIIDIIKRNASHRGWNYSRNLGSLVPSPRAKRANIGEDHPQQWFISNWANVARGLLKDDLQVFVYEEIDPRLEASYLLEDEADLDALLAHLAGERAQEEKLEEIEAEDSKEIIISPAFPRCRYMKGVLPKYAYASAPYEARKMKCPEGTFLVEQNSPVDISNYVYRYLSDIKKEEVDLPFYRAIFPASMTKYEGKKSKDVPLSSPYYIKLLQTYYEAMGYDVCRTNIKGGRSDSGVFMIYLEENEELSDGGYGSKYLEPIIYLPFPTKRDLLFFTESQVNEWIDLAKTKEKKYFVQYMNFAKSDFSLPVSSILTFQLHDDDTFSYFYSFEVLGVFQANVINHKEDIRVFRAIRFDEQIIEYPDVSVTTDPEAMALVDEALQACKEVSEEYKEKKKALASKKPKRKASKGKVVTIHTMKDGELKSYEEKASLLGKQFAVIKRGKAGTYNYPYILVYIPTGQLIIRPHSFGGSSAMKYQKLGDAKRVFEGLEKGFVAPKEYPKGYVIDAYNNKEDQVFVDAIQDAFKRNKSS